MSNRSQMALPAPGGPHKVGRTEFAWVDKNRIDPLANPRAAKRELVVWAWYPATVTSKLSRAPYLPSSWAKVYRHSEGAGRYLEHDLSAVSTHAWDGAAVAGDNQVFPVIIMEPGMGRMPTDYTVFAEALASRGYIVFGVNPTYSANVTVFPDGRVALKTPKGTFPANTDEATLRRDAHRIGKVWQGDVEFVIDRLNTLDAKPGGLFHGRLDLTRIGIFGHSFGGATAFEVCVRDARCKAGADLDGTLWSRFGRDVMKRPFMFMAEDGCGHSCETMREKYLSARASAWYLTISGAKHFNFSDLPLRLSPPVRSLFGGFIGSISPERGLEIASISLVDFFNQTLKGDTKESLAMDLASYPEVRLRTRWQRAEMGRFLQSSPGH